MKETKFIDQNKEKWAKFETLSKNKSADPDEISNLFIEITDDLSYAKTQYPKRTVRVYLNNLAQSVFLQLHKSSSNKGKFAQFWKHDLPLEMYKARKVTLFVFVFFLFAMLLGILSTHNDSDFLGVFTGEAYLERTDEAIERGDPAAVYGTEEGTVMFIAIAWNNVQVSFFAFALGVVFSVGSLLYMLFNGIMLGSFLYYFQLKGTLLTASSAIWIHGAFEISSILLAGTAGLVVGNSILFPGTYTRGQSMIIAGKKGIRIVLGMIPFLVFAAFLESYVTRHYLDMPVFMNWLIIFSCALIMLGYFVIYPLMKFSKADVESIKDDPVISPKSDFQFWKIRKVSELFTSAFTVNRMAFLGTGKVALRIFLVHMVVVLTYLFLTIDVSVEWDFWKTSLGRITGIMEEPDYILMAIHVVFIGMSCGATMLSISAKEKKKKWLLPEWIMASLKAAILVLSVFAIFLFVDGWMLVLMFLAIPLLFMTIYGFIRGDGALKGLELGFQDFFNTIGLFTLFSAVLWLIHIAMFQLEIHFDEGTFETNSDMIIQQIVDLIYWHVLPTMDHPEIVILLFFGAIYLAVIHFMLPVVYTAMALNYYSNSEKHQAVGLRERLKSFGRKSNIYEGDQD